MIMLGVMRFKTALFYHFFDRERARKPRLAGG